jgi:hypothetical protein
MSRESATVPPPAHPLDPVIEVLTELSSAVRAVSIEFKEGMGKLTESVNVLGGRLDGQSRAAQELATEIRSFVSDKERLKGRVIMLEALEHARQEANGKT